MSKIALFRTKLFQVLFSFALVIGVGVAFAIDSDNDGMSDLYETFFQLNPADGTDAVENYDTDQLNNLQESAINTDPHEADTDADGFNDGADSNALSRAVMWWGNPAYTDGDAYTYTGPDWWLGAGRDGGTWNDDGGWQLETNAQGMLYIDIDRSMVTNNLMLNLLHVNAADSVVYLALANANEGRVAVDLFGDLTSNDSEQVLSRYILPLAAYPTASRIIIDATAATEPYTVWVTTLYIDIDADGLDADQEKQVGTSDQNRDSDQDGLSDYEEVFVSYTNPNNPDADGVTDGEKNDLFEAATDSDGDGLSDAEELALGTNPLISDSDGDGLSDGEELLSSRYQQIKVSLSFDAARSLAELMGGHVVTVTSPEEDQRVKALDANIVTTPFGPWLGLSDAAEEGVWKWDTGEDLVYSNWLAGQPDNRKDQEHVASYSYGQWSDWFAGRARRSLIVEYDQPLDALNPDTDGDGLSDGDEMRIYQTSPFKADTDGDGLSDAKEVEWGTCSYGDDFDEDGLNDTEERAAGTDSFKADVDSDGLLDSEELALGTNPLNADTDNDGLSDGEEIANRYYLSTLVLRWREAKADAERQGGHLAVLTSAEEEAAMLQLVGRSSVITLKPWLGAADEVEEGVWKWVTGEVFEYANWDLDEPAGISRAGNPEHYLLYWNDRKPFWHDRIGTVETASLLEYPSSLDPLNPDTDGDGLSDGDEVNIHGSNPRCADTDGDSLSDADEVASGLNPTRIDSDGDGFKDIDELSLGFDPTRDDTDGDGLNDQNEYNVIGTSPLLIDSNTNGINDLTIVDRVEGADFIGFHDSHYKSIWTTSNTVAVLSSINSGIPWIVYELNVTEAGMYQLGIHCQFEGKGRVTHRPRVGVEVDGYTIGIAEENMADTMADYTILTPWLSAGTHAIKVSFEKTDSACRTPFAMEAVELGAVEGGQDWVERRLENDSDGDSISDADEINIYGTDTLNADTDGDGLNDGAELAARTDPLDADSDDDGILDGVEVNESLTNPLVAEFDGTIAVVETISGSDTNAVVGAWEIQGSELISKGIRGCAEYVMNFPEDDLYRLNINATHDWEEGTSSPISPVDASTILIHVDDVYVGSFPLVSADGSYVDVGAFLPVLPAGEHTVKIEWENVQKRMSLRISELQLHRLGGFDANGNGVRDWVEISLDGMAGVDQKLSSYTSPACIEGRARYQEFMSLISSSGTNQIVANKGAGARWYANLLLEQDGITTATFQNDALEVPIQIEWTAFNLMDHDGEVLYVRKGDSVKFVALPADAHGGQFEIEYLLDVGGETVRSPNTRPLIYAFPETGTYTVSGQYTRGKDTVTAGIQVVVLDGTFPEENPACLVGREREWSFEGLPSNIVYEVDDSVEMSLLSCEANVTNQSSIVTKVALRATDTNGDHMMLARLYPGGPILAATHLDTFWIQNATDGYFWTVERYDDSELWQVNSIAKNLPASADIQIKVIIAGVTLDDYTLERWIGTDDYDEIGVYDFRLLHPNASESSTCHTFKAYQDGEFIGEAFNGREFELGEE